MTQDWMKQYMASFEQFSRTVSKTIWFDISLVLSIVACGVVAVVRTLQGSMAAPVLVAPAIALPAATDADHVSSGGGRVNWDLIKARTRQFTETAKARASEAVEAGKIEIRLQQEKSAFAACEKKLDQLAHECGSAAADGSAFADATLHSIQQRAIVARQKLGESRSKRDAAAAELAQLNAKSDPAKAAELTAWIKATDASLRRETFELDTIKRDFGNRVLSANLTEPQFADFYRRRDDIQQQIDQHAANIAGYEQEQVVYKASLGFDIKKAAIIAGAAVVVLVILVWLF